MSPEKRSAVMARIRGRDTAPELALAVVLRRTRFRFESQARGLPGRPDFAFRSTCVAVFVDGDFWHGWRFDEWRDRLSEKWEIKIEANRQRDIRNSTLLLQDGWAVLRVWEHEVMADASACAARVVAAVRARGGGRKNYCSRVAPFSTGPGSLVG